jgi:apolipoprotein N-acyltransferase
MRAEAGPVLASGALFALAFPPVPLVVPAFVCLVPFAVAVARQADDPAGRGAVAARIGLWFGAVGFGAALYWIASALSHFTSLAFAGYAGTLVWLAPFEAAAGAALFAARRATRWPLALVLPLVWVAIEMALGHVGDLAFPWLPLGLSVAKHPVWIQIADVSGVHGVSLWIAFVNGCLADAWLARRHAGRAVVWLTAAAASLVGVAAYGGHRLTATALRPQARIAIVQPNIPEDDKLNAEVPGRFIGPLASLTRRVEAERPALVVWPETALPGYLSSHPAWGDSLRALAAASHTPILFGVLDAIFTGPETYDYFNAAMLTDSTGRLAAVPPYHKRYLVPVVERVPFLDPRWFHIDYFGGFGRGALPDPMPTPAGRLGVLICYESAFPQQSRRYRALGADVLVNITNDAWFGRSAAPWQHEAHLRLRAVENRIGIVRVANTGVSEVIDPLGRVRGATDLFVSDARVYDVLTTSVRTLYVRWGDTAGMGALGATLLLLAWYATGRWRSDGGGSAGRAD